MLFKYLKELISEWFGVALLAADAFIFVLSSTTQKFVLPSAFYWVVAVFAFLIANFRIYSRLQEELDGYESQEANIRIKVLETKVAVDAPILLLETNRVKNSRSEDGLDDNGLPIYHTLYAKFEIENTGHEKGVLTWAIDLSKSDSPEFFELYSNSVNGYFDEDRDKKTMQIDDRSRWEGWWKLPLKLKIEDPKELASKLVDPSSYAFLLVYKTKRIGGESEERFVRIEGDLQSYKQDLVRKWEKREMTELTLAAQDVDINKWTSY